jgi:hypothetical protein
MLSDALHRYFGGSVLIAKQGYEVSYRITGTRKSLLGDKASYNVDVLLFLFGSEINFQEIADHVVADIERPGRKIKALACNWIVCSERGGIYLYEAISADENRKYKSMHNRFLILNTEDGTVSFGPGHIENQGHTNMMRFLIDNYRGMAEATWNSEFDKTMDHCLCVLGR